MFTEVSPRGGRLVVQQKGAEGYSAFVPHPLPPNPPLQIDDEMGWLMERANRALGRLDGCTYTLPNPDLFLYMYVRKEAVLSSQIEGTQASLDDLLEYEGEIEGKSSPDDINEVSNYVDAMNYGLERLQELPLSLRLIKEIHARLMAGIRGGHKSPGEFRTSQNWIGGTRPGNAAFVPPPANEVVTCLGDLEKFLHDESVPPLLKAGLAHAQFETIHPFLDGNGRMGRLLIAFILCHDQVLEKPLLYLSLFFKKHRQEYYERLNAVRRDGDWEGWIKYYLQGVYEISKQATDAAKAIMDLMARDRQKVTGLGKAAPTALALLEMLYRKPYVTIPYVARELRISSPAASKAVNNLAALGILIEVSGKKRDRVFLHESYLSIIREGTELYR
ncbi:MULTISPECIES: Fic family protein [Geobacter]|jgi:Fic family protein|uniref:Fic family protein n=1 Tax=Geobacter sulfurreducens (strain ATCC 51573 / DSM 12127 / PCA) TaxID=243231 RepID=Q74GS7_GEOSL|nr:Fic family protein [Geobacter sulfurreducens]BET60009.1 Fic family protein [Geobacter sp. 60473]AAR33503.1 Fic family protein [Geobacter sulfurreducens PCA]ADI83005.2 Fic family protein [Geobacter sulfurreducens KN400]UAC04268.1 Fic family protein [Geobacter sulfurreducens]BEH08526.1 Fic family protein [Geobacter sulfurreducens subsp. ethanolicus]